MRSLSIVLDDIEIKLSDDELGDKHKKQLQSIHSSSRTVLSELEGTLAKYKELDYHGGSLGKQSKRAWKKLQWEPEEIAELRHRLTSNITLINTFLGRIERYYCHIIIVDSKANEQPNSTRR